MAPTSTVPSSAARPTAAGTGPTAPPRPPAADHETGRADPAATHRRAFEALFEGYHGRIYDYVARLLGDPDAAADVTQDVFVKAYRKLPETAARGAFRPQGWLYRIATNACIDAERHRRLIEWCPIDRLVPWRVRRGSARLLEPAGPYRVAAAPALDDGGGGEIADPAALGDPERLTLERERAAHVQAALGRLRLPHRTVLLLREYHGLSYDEIAEALTTTRAAVKSHLFRAREEFRRVWPRVAPDLPAVSDGSAGVD